MWSVSSEEDEPIFLQQDYNYPGENGKQEKNVKVQKKPTIFRQINFLTKKKLLKKSLFDGKN